MDKVVVSTDPNKNPMTYDDAYILYENEHLQFTNAGLLKSESGYSFIKKLYFVLNRLSESEFSELGRKINNYKGSYNNLKSLDCSIQLTVLEKVNILFCAFLSFIIGLPGFLIYSPSLLLAKGFAKFKIKHVTFYAPVRIAVNMGLHLISSFIVLYILHQHLNLVETIMMFVFLQLSLYAFAIFIDYSRYAKYLFNVNILQNKKGLINLRKEIITKMKN
jgi:hypothetical protein